MRRRAVDLVWNRETRRTRLPWRLVAVFVVLGVLALGGARAAQTLSGTVEATLSRVVSGAQASAATGNVAFVAAQAVSYVGTVGLVGRFLDRRRFRDFGLRIDRRWWTDLGFGLALGAGLMLAVFLVELAAGWVVVTGTFRIARPSFSFWPWFAWGLLTFVVVGVTEELLVRGYLLTNLAEGLTWFDELDPRRAVALAVIGTSLLFAWGHLTNPNASAASAAGIAVAALMLAAGYVLTGELAIPIGVHVTWNAVQGPVLGFPVSGIDFGISVLAVEQRGPALATGGAFGPEAGLLGAAASLLGVGLIAAWARWREGGLAVHPALTTPERRSS